MPDFRLTLRIFGEIIGKITNQYDRYLRWSQTHPSNFELHWNLAIWWCLLYLDLTEKTISTQSDIINVAYHSMYDIMYAKCSSMNLYFEYFTLTFQEKVDRYQLEFKY